MSLENIIETAKKTGETIRKNARNIALATTLTIGAITGTPTYAAGEQTQQTQVQTTERTQQTVEEKTTDDIIHRNGELFVYVGNTTNGKKIYVNEKADPWRMIQVLYDHYNLIESWAFSEIKDEKNVSLNSLELPDKDKLFQSIVELYRLAAENNGDAVPENNEELKKLIEKTGYPVFLTKYAFKVEEDNDKVFLDAKERKVPGYALKIVLKNPQKDYFCDSEIGFRIIYSSNGTIKRVELEPHQYTSKFTKITKRMMDSKGIKKTHFIPVEYFPLKDVSLWGDADFSLCAKLYGNNVKLYVSVPGLTKNPLFDGSKD